MKSAARFSRMMPPESLARDTEDGILVAIVKSGLSGELICRHGCELLAAVQRLIKAKPTVWQSLG